MLGAWALRLLADSPERRAQIAGFTVLHDMLARGANARAAEAVAELLDARA